jgi:hypothetical protein
MLGALLLFTAAAVPITSTPEEVLDVIAAFEVNCYSCKVLYSEARGYGIFMTKNVTEGEVVLASADAFDLDPDADYPLKEYFLDFEAIDRLKVRVLYEKFMAPRRKVLQTEYVHSLPTVLTSAEFWSQAHIDLYSNTSIAPSTDLTVRDLTKYKKVVEVLKGLRGVPAEMLEEDSYFWAQAIIHSRDSPSQDGTQLRPLLRPLLDIANHWPITHEAKRICNGPIRMDSANPGAGLLAYKDLKEGEEFFNCYGLLSNNELALRYGFTIKDNIDQSIVQLVSGSGVCFETMVGNDLCEYRLWTGKISSHFLQYFRSLKYRQDYVDATQALEYYRSLPSRRETKQSFLKAIYKYRAVVIGIFKGRLSLREVRRQQGWDYISNMVLEVAESERTGLLSHLKALDRLTLDLLWSDLTNL